MRSRFRTRLKTLRYPRRGDGDGITRDEMFGTRADAAIAAGRLGTLMDSLALKRGWISARFGPGRYWTYSIHEYCSCRSSSMLAGGYVAQLEEESFSMTCDRLVSL